jgi:hypothetical protein
MFQGSVLSDTQGLICAVLLVASNSYFERNEFHVERSIADHFLNREEISTSIVSGRYYNADFRLGGMLDAAGDRISYPVSHNILGCYVDAGFSSEQQLLAWLNASLPFSDRFSVCELSDGATEDVRLIPWLARIDHCKQLNDRFRQLKYGIDADGVEFWQGYNGRNTIKLSAESPYVSHSPKHEEMRSILLNAYNQEVDRRELDWDRRFELSPEQIRKARGISDHSMSSKLRHFPQDQFVVRQLNGKTTIGIRNGEVAIKDQKNLFDFCRSMFPSATWREVETLQTEGGNMHVAGNVLFMGRDDFSRYSSTSSGFSLSQSGDERLASNRVIQMVYGDTTDKKLIWIGTKGAPRSRLSVSEIGNQPAYHTDLFFCPLGILNENEPHKFTYLYAQPEACFMIPYVEGPLHPELQALVDWFTETDMQLRADLIKNGFEPDPVVVPLVLEVVARDKDDTKRPLRKNERPWVTGYSPFVNGLINEHHKRIEYLMPQFGQHSSVILKTAQNETVRIIAESIPALTITPVTGSEFDPYNLSDSGLRCRVKVVDRK